MTTTRNRLYRGSRQSLSAPGMVLVSVADDVAGARRKLLDPRLPATASRHRPGCACGFDWGVPSPNTKQLGVAILVDHFEQNGGDLQCAKTLMKCPNEPDPIGAAVALAPKFAEDMLVPIPMPTRQWTITTQMICDYMAFLSGKAAAPPAAAHASIEPGHGAETAATYQVAAFVAAAREGRLLPLPDVVASALLEQFVSCIKEALVRRLKLAPAIGAKIGPVELQLQIFEQSDRVLLERVLGQGRLRAALRTAEDMFGLDALRSLFGEWVVTE